MVNLVIYFLINYYLITNYFMLQKKFKLRANALRYVKLKMGEAWKSRRIRLYDKQNGDGTMPLQQLMENVPDGVLANDWAAFVQYRRSAASQVHYLIS